MFVKNLTQTVETENEGTCSNYKPYSNTCFSKSPFNNFIYRHLDYMYNIDIPTTCIETLATVCHSKYNRHKNIILTPAKVFLPLSCASRCTRRFLTSCARLSSTFPDPRADTRYGKTDVCKIQTIISLQGHGI